MGRRRRRQPPREDSTLIDEVRAFHKSITKSQSKIDGTKKPKKKALCFAVPMSELEDYCRKTLHSSELARSISAAAYLYKFNQKWISNACHICGQWLLDDQYNYHIREEHMSHLSQSEKALKPKPIEEQWKLMLRTWDWRPVDPETGELTEDPERMANLKKIGEFFEIFMHLEESTRYCEESRFLSRCQLLHLIELAVDYQYWIPDEPVNPETVESPDVFCALDTSSMLRIVHHLEFLFELFKLGVKILDQSGTSQHRLSEYCKSSGMSEPITSSLNANTTNKQDDSDQDDSEQDDSENKKDYPIYNAVSGDSKRKKFLLKSSLIDWETGNGFELLLSYLFGNNPEETYQLVPPEVQKKSMNVLWRIEEQMQQLSRRLRKKCRILNNLEYVYALQSELYFVRTEKKSRTQEPMLRKRLDSLISHRETTIGNQELDFEFEFISSVLAFARTLEASTINLDGIGSMRISSLKNRSVEEAFRKIKHDVLTELDVLDLEIMQNLEKINRLEGSLLFLSCSDFKEIILPIMRSFLQQNWKRYMIVNPPKECEDDWDDDYESYIEREKIFFRSFEFSDLSDESSTLKIDNMSIFGGIFQVLTSKVIRFAYFKLALNFEGKYSSKEGTKRIKGKLIISGESCWEFTSDIEYESMTVVKGQIDGDENNHGAEKNEIDFKCLEQPIRRRLREFEKEYKKKEKCTPVLGGHSTETKCFPRDKILVDDGISSN